MGGLPTKYSYTRKGGMGGDLNKLFIVQIGRRDATK